MDSKISNYGGSETLLIVDDDKEVLSLLSHLFSCKGYNVIAARDGEEAVEAYKKNCDNIHLVLMDIVMPRKDGIAASVEITEHNPNAIVVFMSGYNPHPLGERSGMNFIKKPFLPSELIKTIRDCLDGTS